MYRKVSLFTEGTKRDLLSLARMEGQGKKTNKQTNNQKIKTKAPKEYGGLGIMGACSVNGGILTHNQRAFPSYRSDYPYQFETSVRGLSFRNLP